MASPWIKHDGRRPDLKSAGMVELCFCSGIGHITAEGLDSVSQHFPGFYWDWKLVWLGWFRFKKIRVCHEEEYAPIIRYRFDKGEPMAVAIAALRKLAANPNIEITGPEIAPVIKEPSDA